MIGVLERKICIYPFFDHYSEYMGGIKYYSSDLSRGCLSIALHCSMSLVMRKSIWIWYCAIDTCTHVYNYTCISMWLCTCKVNMFVCIPLLLRALDSSKRAGAEVCGNVCCCAYKISDPLIGLTVNRTTCDIYKYSRIESVSNREINIFTIKSC